jgi:hypothetical protein
VVQVEMLTRSRPRKSSLSWGLAVIACVTACGGASDSRPSSSRDAGSDAPSAEAGPDAKGGACSEGGACVADDDCKKASADSYCVGGACKSATICLGDSHCPSIPIGGDPPSTVSALRGYADPSVRAALDGSTLYMGYSRPTTITTAAGDKIAIHADVAESTDGGATWNNGQVLFGATATETVPGIGVTAYFSSEELSLATGALDPSKPTTPYWMLAREKYYNSLTGNKSLKTRTYVLRVGAVQADSPAALAGGEPNELVFIEKNTDPSFAAAVAPASHVKRLGDVLTAGGQKDCDLALSPAILYVAPSVYLVIECFRASDPVNDSDIVLIKANPAPSGQVQPVIDWNWKYVGSFGTAADAALMKVGANQVIQPDLALSQDGTVLFIADPSTYATTVNGARLGCNVIAMQSLDPPVLAKRCGRFDTRALVRTPDLAAKNTFGDQAGSCGYEPTAQAGGLIIARKTTQGQVITTTLNNTGVHE